MGEDSKKTTVVRSTKEAPVASNTTPSDAPPSIVPISEILPQSLLLLPVSQTTLFPGMMVPLILPEGKLTKTIENVAEGTGYIGVVLSKEHQDAIAVGPSTSVTGLPAAGTVPETQERKSPQPFYQYGVAARVIKKINLPDNQVSVLLAGIERFKIETLVSEEPYFVANVNYIFDELEKDTELEALLRSVLTQFKQLSKDNPLISEEVKVALVNIDGPGKLADFIASVLVRDVKDYQTFLSTSNTKRRLNLLLMHLKKELDVQKVQKKINDEINSKVAQSQRDFYLTEQLKQIQKELGKEEESSKLLGKFKERLKDKKLAKDVVTRINEEFEKLENVSEQSSEYSVAVNYLDWATSLPWGVKTEESFTLSSAKRILSDEHFGLKDVKERILEHIAVRKLKPSEQGTVLCFVGPPGTGKTSLGKSIAHALNRKFYRFSVGGMRDEAEVRGHRRTYVGAMPGKIVQGLKRVGTENPVFLIDEIDKIGKHTHAGDPASALLELLDPEQNKEFMDHYLDLPYDCSNIFFITTANTVDSIPAPLLDRMEVISLHGYTDTEKLHIAQQFLIPKQIEKCGLKSSQLKFHESGIRYIIHRYARESGVRNLDKQIARIARKVAFKIASGSQERFVIKDPKQIEKLLGIPPFLPEEKLIPGVPGVVTGLAWTQFGGDVLHIESKAVPGKGILALTGSLGDVMKESANIAYTYVKAYCAEQAKLNPKKSLVAENYFETNQIHLHFPAGAIPKDGPSAGITIVASLYSLVTKKPIRTDVAMTGELSLTGRVLPVGGIKEKLLAAKRAGIKRVLIPKMNEKDLKEIEPEIKQGLQIIKLTHVDECLKLLF